MLKNSWCQLTLLYLAAFLVALSQMKVPPMMETLELEYQVSMPTIAYLMTGFTLTGIVLALPSALIVLRIGLKWTGPLLMLCLVIGNLISASASSFALHLAGRIFEGISLALIILYGAMLIRLWFQPKQVGLAMGIFMTFTAVGALIGFNAVPRLSAVYGWQFVWWLIAGLALVELILLVWLLKVPPLTDTAITDQPQPALFSAFKIGQAWLLAIAQGCIAFILFAYFTLYPLVFQNFYGLAPYDANQIASYSGLFGIFTCIFSGYLITKTGKAAFINVVAFVGLMVINGTTFYLGASTIMYTLHVLATSICIGLVITATLTLPSSMTQNHAEAGTIVAMINFVYFIGIALSSPVVVAFSQSGSSEMGALPLVVVAIIGLIVSLGFLISNGKAQRRHQARSGL